MGPRDPKRDKSLKNKNNNDNVSIVSNPSTSSQRNQFMDLDSEVDLSSEEQHPVSKKSKTSPKPPPMTVQGLDHHHVTDLLKNFKNAHTLKLTPVGIQVFPLNSVAFKQIKHLFDIKGTQYYTHALREDQLSKFVLHGYINVSEITLMSQLKELNLDPVKIKKMTIKQKKHFDHAVYLIYFNKSSNIKISQLRDIKAIEHVIVKWDFYSNRRNGPIQCSNCLSYGHGGHNCHLIPRCIRCSLNHKSIECPKLLNEHKMQTRTRIPDNELKCANCGQNHAANYSKCEKRMEFIERQRQYRLKTQKNSTRSSNHFEPAPQLNDFQFPRLRAENPIQQPRVQQPEYSNNDLFSAPELMNIFKELFTKMQRANSKMEQITVLGELVIKYASR